MMDGLYPKLIPARSTGDIADSPYGVIICAVGVRNNNTIIDGKAGYCGKASIWNNPNSSENKLTLKVCSISKPHTANSACVICQNFITGGPC
jgi:hypothetical protein